MHISIPIYPALLFRPYFIVLKTSHKTLSLAMCPGNLSYGSLCTGIGSMVETLVPCWYERGECNASSGNANSTITRTFRWLQWQGLSVIQWYFYISIILRDNCYIAAISGDWHYLWYSVFSALWNVLGRSCWDKASPYIPTQWCVNRMDPHCSGNGLAPFRRQAITRSNVIYC